MKTRQDNNVTGHRGVIFVEYDIGLLSLIRQCVVYDEDETWKRHDRSYRSTLRWKEIELSWPISQAWSMMKSKHENEVIDYTGTVYDENETGQ